jgi:hypothetical protein
VTTRQAAIRAVLERATAAGRKVYGYSSDKPGCELVLRGRVPAEFDRLAVEGDQRWTLLPPEYEDES